MEHGFIVAPQAGSGRAGGPAPGIPHALGRAPFGPHRVTVKGFVRHHFSPVGSTGSVPKATGTQDLLCRPQLLLLLSPLEDGPSKVPGGRHQHHAGPGSPTLQVLQQLLGLLGGHLDGSQAAPTFCQLHLGTPETLERCLGVGMGASRALSDTPLEVCVLRSKVLRCMASRANSRDHDENPLTSHPSGIQGNSHPCCPGRYWAQGKLRWKGPRAGWDPTAWAGTFRGPRTQR